jgi:SNF2 family DNA or RNA helicase
MAILHGCWLSSAQASQLQNLSNPKGREKHQTGYFFVWGEIWRGYQEADGLLLSTAPISYPYAMNPEELLEFIPKLFQKWGQVLPSAIATLDASQISISQPQHAKSKTKAKTTTKPKTKTDTKAEIKAEQLISSVQFLQPILHLPGALEPPQILAHYSTTPLTEVLSLYPWQVAGIALSPAIASEFLSALPLRAEHAEESDIGDDLKFWSHVVRWSLDLLVRAKFLPTLSVASDRSDVTYHIGWQPLLDSAVDRSRLKMFREHLPGICRMVQAASADAAGLAIDFPPPSEAILMDFIQHLLESQIQSAVDPELAIAAAKEGMEPAMVQWLAALGGSQATDSALSASDFNRLDSALQTWTAPLQQSLHQQNAWRTCFQLRSPTSGGQNWHLDYYLQSIDQPELLIGAAQIWSTSDEQLVYQGQPLERPQETLLMGLGLASRVYPLLDSSLQTARPQQHTLTPPQVYEFLKAAAWRLEDSGFGVLLPPSLANREGWANRLGLKIQAQAPKIGKGALGLSNLLNFKWELSIGGQTLSKAEFDRLVAQNTPLVEINGEWVELRPQDVKAAQSFFATRKNQTGLTLEDALRISTGDTLTLEKLPVVSFEAAGALQELITTLTGNQTIEPIANPPGFTGELRPYQGRGVGWLAFLERWGLGACLADDMGLGKSVQLIAFLLHLQSQDALKGPTLLVCPTSVLGNWEREIKRFSPQLKTVVHHGSQRLQGQAFAQQVQQQHLVITSYPLVYRDAEALTSVNWQNLVLDEAQNVKNPEARQSKSVRQLTAQFRIALTGTPLENRLTELWSILEFLNPGYLGPRNFFQRRFATPIERYGDTASLQTLRSLVQPFILRRLKSDREIIQDLPEKQEMTVFCGLTPEQAALYEQTVQQSLADIESAEGIQRRGMILATLTKLKQICNHPAQFLKQEGADLEGRSGKLKRLEEMLEEALAEGDRALVFTQFAEMGKLLQQYLVSQLGRETLFLYGNTAKSQREAMIDRFQNDPQGPRIFILSLKAGGVGLNLTRANHVFHFDRWWNPAVENQATDRVFRIGQVRNVQVHKFVCTGTLEEKIHEQIESKKALAEQVVGAGENWLTDLDTDQLRNLLLLDRGAVIEEETP